MNISSNKIINYASLFSMTLITVFSIINQETTVFYLLFLFWCDEFIRTLFDGFGYFFRKVTIKNLSNYLSNVKSRFFFLFVYLVFIVFIFGLIIDWKNGDLVIDNLSVLFFKNNLFNYTVLTFLVREIFLFFNNKNPLEAKSILSKGIIILHISLVLGIFFWFISSQKIDFFKEYAALISIVPFLILKLYFEVKTQN